jgi:nucleoside diphosphate kinase
MTELAYILVNPYSMYKSRTGGVISRLLSRSSSLELIGARMFAPSRQLVEEYIQALTAESCENAGEQEINNLVCSYVRKNYMPDADGSRKRVMFILVKGDNAVERLRREVAGSIIRQTVGETIRDTYGDLIKNEKGEVVYFEPAVLIGASSDSTKRHIDIWLKYSDTDSGILYDTVPWENKENIQNTLVMIKPDTFAESRTRAGTVIDLFAKTGLCIIGIKVIHISVAQAMEFYAPVREVFIEKFIDGVRDKVRASLANAFDFEIPDDTVNTAAENLRIRNADHEFGRIVKFITGLNPWETPRNEWTTPGKETCIALVYQGTDAIAKIREQLGSTDPSKAAPATVRKEFGTDVMVNTAHASDSPENAEREIGILSLATNDLPELVRTY